MPHEPTLYQSPPISPESIHSGQIDRGEDNVHLRPVNDMSGLLSRRRPFTRTPNFRGGFPHRGDAQAADETSSSSGSDDALDSDGDSVMDNGADVGPPTTTRQTLPRRAPLKSILRPPTRFSPYGPSPRSPQPSSPLASGETSKIVAFVQPMPIKPLAIRNLPYSQPSPRRYALERCREVRSLLPYAGDIRSPAIQDQVREARDQLKNRPRTSTPCSSSNQGSTSQDCLNESFRSCRSRTPTPFPSPTSSHCPLPHGSQGDFDVVSHLLPVGDFHYRDGLQGLFDDVSASDSAERVRLTQDYNEADGSQLATIQEEDEGDDNDLPTQAPPRAPRQVNWPLSSTVPNWLSSSNHPGSPTVPSIASSRESTPSFRQSPAQLLQQSDDAESSSLVNQTQQPVREPRPRFELAPTICPTTRSSASTDITMTRRTPLGNASKRPWNYLSFVLNSSSRQLCVFLKPCTGDITQIMHAVQAVGLIAFLFTKSAAVLDGADGPVTYDYGHDWWIFVTKDVETCSAFNDKRHEGWNPGEFGTKIGKLGWGCDASLIEKEFDLVEEAAARGESVLLPAQFMAGTIGAMVVWCSIALVC